MPMRGAEALNQEYEVQAPYLPTPEFEVHEGGRNLGRREREGLDPFWRRAFKWFVVAAVAATVLGVLRVQMTVLCVEKLSENAELSAQVSEAEELARAYALEGSILSSADRIERIATQNLDMVYVGAGEPLGSPSTEG